MGDAHAHPHGGIGHGHAHGHVHAHDRDHAHDHGDGDGPRHAHDHAHDHRATPSRVLGIALVLTGGFMVVEAIAGWWSGSLALLSDAGHMLSDAGALGLALAAQRVADRPRTRTRTFGFRRAETLAALANATALGATSALIVAEAIERFSTPQGIEARAMLAVATTGLLVNLASAWILARGRERNANVRAALAHVLSDAAGSVAAIVAGLLVWWRGWAWADPACSLIISLLIAIAAWRLVRSTAHVLMESAPAGLDVAALERTIRATKGVADLHDLHAWRIEEGFDAVTVHVVLAPGAHGVEVAREVAREVGREHGVEHVTVQPEAPEEGFVPVDALRRDRRRGASGS